MNNSQSPVDLRADADSKVAAWRALHEAEEALIAEHTAFSNVNKLPDGTWAAGRLVRPSELALAHAKRELLILEAKEKTEIAKREATIALDACELAEGAADAVARHLPTLRIKLDDDDADVRKAKEALAAAEARRFQRVVAVLQAEARTKKRREAAGLPFVGSGFAPAIGVKGGMGKTFQASADEALARGIPVSDYGSEVARQRDIVIQIAAALEEVRLQKEAKEKHEEKYRINEAQIEADERRRAHERAQAENNEREAALRRRDELAANYLARTGS